MVSEGVGEDGLKEVGGLAVRKLEVGTARHVSCTSARSGRAGLKVHQLLGLLCLCNYTIHQSPSAPTFNAPTNVIGVFHSEWRLT
jgi:hypothetical protein